MKNVLLLLVYGLLSLSLLICLKGIRGVPPLGALLDPVNGLYYTARNANQDSGSAISLSGLTDEVRIIRDDRGVPHIFASDDFDGITALGYVVAQDRLFQMDFIRRVAAGRLSEILGPSMMTTDRFLRQTGMVWGGEKNLTRIEKAGGIEDALLESYVRGVNTYIESLHYKAWPFELKLIGYEPTSFTKLDVLLVLQYMAFDLSYRSNDAEYNKLKALLGAESYAALYPQFAELFIPIIPEKGGMIKPQDRRPVFSDVSAAETEGEAHNLAAANILADRQALQASWKGSLLEGFIDGKGSNNWVVGPARSATDAPILAGDMHLSLWLPSIWYEVHLVTPSINTYGVTIPGSPLPVEGFNDRVGWAFTNTGTDQIDHFALKLDASGTQYEYMGAYRPLELVPDTIHIKGTNPQIDTLYYAHWGPVIKNEEGAVATRWVAHDSSRTIQALWHMNRAQSFDAFQDALRYWDTPMQNVVYGDVAGNIALRSSGYLPIRKSGHGMGLLEGWTDEHAWIGRVPFEELPFSYNPDQGYLTSTNQQPADSTYSYYQGHNWAPGYRSLRIDALLSGKARHTVDDLKRYQSDVYVVQRDFFAPLLDALDGLSPHASELRALLMRWEGEADVDRPEPVVLEIYLDHLEQIVWDEPAFGTLRHPNQERLYLMLAGKVSDQWLDIQDTPDVKEGAQDVMKKALEQTAISLENEFGWERANWRWGNHHKVLFRHYTRSEALKPLWRGPYEYPGFASTLSPASNRTTTHSASWRMVVDFSTTPPKGYGVYPGGQSGNPFSPNYDAQIDAYINFEHFELARPANPAVFPSEQIRSMLHLLP